MLATVLLLWTTRIRDPEALVAEDGRVQSTKILKALPFGLDFADTAARKWTFRPRPAPWHATLTFHFGSLTEDECRNVQCDGLQSFWR